MLYNSRLASPIGIVCGCLAVLALTACSAKANTQNPVQAALKKQLTTANEHRIDSGAWPMTKTLYRKRESSPLWVNRDGIKRQARVALDVLKQADQHGLEPKEYAAEWLEEHIQGLDGGLFSKPDPEALAEFDLRLTQAVLAYAGDQLDGRVEPKDVQELGGKDVYVEPRKADLVADLNAAVSRGDLDEMLENLIPVHRGYHQLKALLKDYRDIASRERWPKVEPGPLMGVGEEGPRVLSLKRRLQESGDFQGDTESPNYDRALEQAVKRFQLRNGIQVDGKVGPGTLEALNETIAHRIERIKLNMDRWRWLPNELGDRYVMINIPEFQLRLYDDDQEQLTMAVVVGKEMTPTPLFSDRMEYVVIAPYWKLPTSISHREVLPKVLEDRSYLEEKRYQVLDEHTLIDPDDIDWDEVPDEGFPYRMRQLPGPNNALGLVKFIFPNQFAVYMHDTPADELFDENLRAFSHGCIRLAEPFRFATAILGDEEDWKQKALEATEASPAEPVRVDLDEPIPVYITYFSVRVSHNGDLVRFLPDIYDFDKTSLALLEDKRRRFAEVLHDPTTHPIPSESASPVPQPQ